MTASLWLPQPNNPVDGPYFTHERRALLARNLLDRISALPGVEDAALSTLLPLDGERAMLRIEIEGRSVDGSERPSALGASVSSRYFDVMRIPNPSRPRLFGGGRRKEPPGGGGE